jgi:hypothetical protein
MLEKFNRTCTIRNFSVFYGGQNLSFDFRQKTYINIMKDTNYTYHLQQRIALAVSRMQISPCNSIIDFF